MGGDCHLSSRRQPSLPPYIPGFEYVSLLGMGGFADVFEYQQTFPKRPVAVKVLLDTALDEGAHDAFFAEANIMARLSQHPSIVAIHQAAIAADGRPYFVMEYCARPSLGSRYRTERISVAEVLRTGVRVASAVETAHRAGVLHRDIKPANILATDFGWPALTDFGIAGAIGDQMIAAGMSIPWAPPELLGEHPVGDARSDVYSIAATLYTLLEGKSPFEVRGGSNTPLDLITRIETMAPPRINRVDVPTELNDILTRGMQRNPDLRFASALALAHALQQVERQMQLPVTGIDVTELVDPGARTGPAAEPAVPPPTDPGAAQSTRLRPITTISAQPPATGPVAGSGAPSGTQDPEGDATRLRPITSISAVAGAPVHSAPAPGVREPVSPPQVATTSPANFVVPLPAPGPAGLGSAAGGLRAAGPREFQADETTDPGYFRARRRAADQKVTVGGSRQRTIVSLLSVVALLAVLFFVGKTVLGSDARDKKTDQEIFKDPGNTGQVTLVPSVKDITSVRSSTRTVTFTWTNPEPEDGDSYRWRIVDVDGQGPVNVVAQPEVEVDLAPGKESVCIEVSLVRQNGKGSTTPIIECS